MMGRWMQRKEKRSKESIKKMEMAERKKREV